MANRVKKAENGNRAGKLEFHSATYQLLSTNIQRPQGVLC